MAPAGEPASQSKAFCDVAEVILSGLESCRHQNDAVERVPGRPQGLGNVDRCTGQAPICSAFTIDLEVVHERCLSDCRYLPEQLLLLTRSAGDSPEVFYRELVTYSDVCF